MKKKAIFGAISVLALVSLACSITVNLPTEEFKVGPTTTEPIRIPAPSAAPEPVDLTLNFAAGELKLQPGAESDLVVGEATYNVVEMKPEVKTSENRVVVSTGHVEIKGLPSFSAKYVNEWDLKLGKAPMNLTIKAGAYKGEYELGGLSLASFSVTDGAAQVDVSFSAPNQIEMSTLRYETGASTVELTGLANANFERMTFKGGAGSYTLDFSGELKRDATVDVDAGLSTVTIYVPRGMAARVLVDRGLSNVDISGDWEKSGNDYTLPGSGPRITINVNIGAGNVELRNR